MPDVTVDILASMQGAEKVTRDLDKLNKEGEELHKTFSAFVLETGIERLQDGIEESTKEVRRLGDAIEEVSASKLAKDADRVREALEGANTEASKLGRSVLNAQAPLKDIRPDTKTPKPQDFRFQRAARAIGGIQQVTGFEGLGNAASFLNTVDDVQDLTESVGGLGAVLNPAVAGLGAVTLGMVVFNEVAGNISEKVKRASDANKEYAEQLAFVDEIARLSSDELKNRSEETRLSLERQIQTTDDLLARQQETLSNLSAAEQAFSTFQGAILGGGAYKDTAEEAKAAKDEIARLSNELAILEQVAESASAITAAGDAMALELELRRLRREGTSEEIQNVIDRTNIARQIEQARFEETARQLEDVNQQIADIESSGGVVPEALLASQESLQVAYDQSSQAVSGLIDSIDAYNGILPEVIANENRLADSTQRLADMTKRLDEARESEEQRLQATQKAFQSSANERDRAEQALLNTEAQLAALEADRAKMLERRGQEEALAASHDAQEGALQAQIDAANASAEVSKIQTDAASKQVQITSKLRDDINAINADFMRSELRAIQAFNLEQKRLREDTEDQLKQAALDNDVNAFLAARDSAVKQLSRGGEDFAIEREQAKQDRDLRLAELREGAKQELDLLRTETQNQLILLQQGGEARLAQVRALEQQMVMLRERFAQEDRALQERFNQEDHNARVRALNETLQLNQTAFERLTAQTRNLAYQVGVASAQGYFAGAGSVVDASIAVAINQGIQELAGG